MSVRAVAVHLHCYQPPRDNPWLNVVLREPSAAPWHDWNERITAECYRPQTAARLLDHAGLVAGARNLYSECSFNVGPTLHRWLAEHAPDVDDAVRAGERSAAARHDGHGTAICQPYVHAIVPLASDRDRRTLIRWGVADFRHRFGRDPEGIWLPETAVDTATLEAVADAGIGFTIVAPQQIARVRVPGGEWAEVDAETLDPTAPYRVGLPSGRSVTACVFDGSLSRAVAFDRGLLSDGDALGQALLAGFRDREGPQLLLVATDGETFGHHHRHGEMALARALALVEADPDTRLMTPGQFLALHPAQDEAQLVEPSAWSCAHGVGRWERDCGCSTGGQPGWNQAWRGPLRSALDWLGDAVAPRWEEAAGRLLADPWAARDAYVDVLLDPSQGATFWEQHRLSGADLGAENRVWALLELQRHLLAAGTSCAWFFADPASLETALVMRHAARVVELSAEWLSLDLADELVERLAQMRSNRAGEGDGRAVWQGWVTSARLGVLDVAAAWTALAVADEDTAPRAVLGRECRLVEDGAAPASEAGPGSVVGVLEVTDPVSGERSSIEVAGHWTDDGGPAGSVWGEGRRDFTAADLPDDVVLGLLLACLAPERSGRPRDAVLERAASSGLQLRGLAAVDADRALVMASSAALADPRRLATLDAWVALTQGMAADHGWFAATNAVLALRERLAGWEADPADRLGPVLRRLASRLRVALPGAPEGGVGQPGQPGQE